MNKIRKVKVVDVLNPLGEDARESVTTTFKLLTSALTLVSALAWNEAIKGVFELMKGSLIWESLGVVSPFVYAILVTLITVIAINKLESINKGIIEKAIGKKEKAKENK